MTDLNTISSTTMLISGFTNIFFLNRANIHRLLDKAVEQQSSRLRGSAIESKNEFIEIIVQMGWSRSSLVSSHQPPLEQGSHAVSQRQQVFPHLSRLSNNRMLIIRSRQLTIPFPPIGTNLAFELDALSLTAETKLSPEASLTL